ncbi:MAG: dihydroorotate dehydrogenase electron transfer subunit [Butyrivibrio sp.]|nr:dihydroorotate dehydrogenase electron transfer subunit [Butyrivibrio sp.]
MAKKKKIEALVISQKMLADGILDMWIATPLAESAKPGQFIGIYPMDMTKLLPRPISICEVSDEKDALRLVYRISGKGTAEFALYKQGQHVKIIGILGDNGFPVEASQGKKVLVMGGGIGVPPLLELSKQLNVSGKPESIDIVMGYRNNETFLKEDFEQYGNLHIATEDGSIGTKGNVIDAVKENNIKADVIYACGPMPMLRAIKKYASENNIKAYISLEERMACGVGACLGCVCTTTHKDEHSHVNNARICTDGPVFDAESVDI